MQTFFQDKQGRPLLVTGVQCHNSSTGSASREQYRRVSISRPVYGATMPSTRGAPAGFSPRAFPSRPSVSHASPTPL